MNSTNDVGNVGSELQLLPRALQLQKRELALTKLLTCYMCSKPLKDTVECDEAHVVCGACFRTLPDKCCQVCKNDIGLYTYFNGTCRDIHSNCSSI